MDHDVLVMSVNKPHTISQLRSMGNFEVYKSTLCIIMVIQYVYVRELYMSSLFGYSLSHAFFKQKTSLVADMQFSRVTGSI